MHEIALILPNQLFSDNPLLDKKRKLFLIEHPRYFTDFLFHKQKLLLHRASMKEYFDVLKQQGYQAFYIEYAHVKETIDSIPPQTIVHIIDPVDHDLENELKTYAKTHDIIIEWYESPMFLTSTEWIRKNFKKKKRFLMHSFYMKQRKGLNILIHKGKPVGGAWSFDKENQKNIPEGVEIPAIKKQISTAYIKEAQKYVETHFSKNPGTMDAILYPTNSLTAKKAFDQFLTERLKNFGPYEDAIKKEESFLFHSILTPALNTGLITPEYVIEKTMHYAKNHAIPLNSLEGFIRQIIGWREFVRAVYQVIGKEQKKANLFSNKESLPSSFYNGTTQIEPIDATIYKLLATGYSHHIERLMILGNFMLISEINPNDVYQWFMEMYIDSYDWVMVPNVYGMSQYADQSMTTKPYITSSQYILKMSNYKKGPWCNVWDALFWTFMKKHEDKLAKILRMHFMLNALRKKTPAQLHEYYQIKCKWQKKLKPA
ncbi:MAG: cryptochrome/photolyase family protein [Candidatus Dependentiae bacterium]|nr:cryptochrome/photolyase family protein [Candidatus Dependentiae bacterium]